MSSHTLKFIRFLSPKHLSASSSYQFWASTGAQFHTSHCSKSHLSSLLARRGLLGSGCVWSDDWGCRSFYSHAAGSADGSSRKVFAPYTVFKGKAALSISPLLPSFKKLDSGGHQLDRRGVIMLKLWPAIGERKYDWDKRQTFALSATEVGSLLTLGPQDSCEFFHDPSMKTSNAGQVRKSLSIKANGEGNGYFFSLSVANNISKSTERLTVPLTSAEFAVIRAASGFALPHILGWDHIVNQPLAGASASTKAEPLVKNLEWDR